MYVLKRVYMYVLKQPPTHLNLAGGFFGSRVRDVADRRRTVRLLAAAVGSAGVWRRE